MIGPLVELYKHRLKDMTENQKFLSILSFKLPQNMGLNTSTWKVFNVFFCFNIFHNINYIQTEVTAFDYRRILHSSEI